jgi:RNA polymerase sigma-70 factor (ECF subfamily)
VSVEDVAPTSSRRGGKSEERWVADFHRGDRDTFEKLYREYFQTVDGAVSSVLAGADKETVIHDVFCQLMMRAEVRSAFRGGSFRAWLGTLARNRAVDFHRRRKLEQPMGTDPEAFAGALETRSFEPKAEARLVLERFSGTLPEKWRRVFQKRFVEGLEQQEAADALDMSRTTLAYQEYRIRRLLRRFVLQGRS